MVKVHLKDLVIPVTAVDVFYMFMLGDADRISSFAHIISANKNMKECHFN